METIKITVEGFDFDEVATELKTLSETQDIDIQVKPSSGNFGGLALDPATIIVAGSSVLSALITALFAYLATRKSGTIVIAGSSGSKIEIPKGTPKEDIEYYIEQARKLDAEQITLARVS
ncbi:MAG: hypothetical protein D8M57_06700 [Candidatus Scalindua sp. AMX11]|nr:MAG: hypothetical protein DWQ00_13695 [Candidatus Scalindua sp.]NOG85353.1 hypothetical protein [Planctomycetota bacterium]RZV83955.1 MAG: hypothetical protein EX341_08440 [Candidatus Scalindua sp. SCAELEC01]TDE65770.1 MAG: hypothetical protein D8M57_06700 [Candidatus Scalindua sp. AMX11]GJQ59624.1 MAG: hypothetical protein SCALA701_24250 [Candidatus Scalindua sp.]